MNKPIEHYGEMATIFGNSLATGKYAKGSSEPLCTDTIGESEAGDDDGNRNGVGNAAATTNESGATSSSTKPKRAKTSTAVEDGLQTTFRDVGERIAVAIDKAGSTTNSIPEDLFSNLLSLPGFEEVHISHYYAHLVENPHIARSFNLLPLSHKCIWVARFISKHFPG